MSHFTVLVIGEDVDKQLAPYDENIVVPKYIEYTKEQLIQKGKDEAKHYVEKGAYAKYIKDPDDYMAKGGFDENHAHIKYLQEGFPKQLQWTDEEIYEDQIKYIEPEMIDEEGNVWSTYNPKSKWDWYVEGGRWNGMLITKDGRYVNSARKGDIDFDTMLKNQIDSLNEQYDEYQAAIRLEDDANTTEEREDAELSLKVARVMTFGFDNEVVSREEFIGKAKHPLVTFAVVKDGEWYEKGRMGWWAMVSDEMDEGEWDATIQTFIDEADDDEIFTIIDCHI